MKRFQQALQQDGAYNSTGFHYQYDATEKTYLYPQNPNGYESLHNGKEMIFIEHPTGVMEVVGLIPTWNSENLFNGSFTRCQET